MIRAGSRTRVVLTQARLAILDLSPAGHQPMQDHPTAADSRPNWVDFNGEIFNYEDMHDDLAAAGWPCTRDPTPR